MNDDRQIDVLIAQADVQRRLANHRGATALLQRALTLDPEHAQAHAALAFTLLDARRLRAAVIEMRAALALDGNDPYIHLVAAAVQMAERKLDDAWAHCLVALEGPSVDAAAYVLGAQIRSLAGDRERARELLREALVLDPAHTDALTQLARLELRAGDVNAAVRYAREALESDPGDRRAHVVAGYIDLARGDPASAEQHARFALGQNATDLGSLALWASIQARRSWLLGAWWRWNAWLALGDDRRRIALLLVGFVVARVAIIITDELDHDAVSRGLELVWMGVCAYTWFAPRLFRRMLARELGTVRLDPEF
jgi:tetratricopeptide (TPR) repeat protein